MNVTLLNSIEIDISYRKAEKYFMKYGGVSLYTQNIGLKDKKLGRALDPRANGA